MLRLSFVCLLLTGCMNMECEPSSYSHRMKPTCTKAEENSLEALQLSLAEGKKTIEVDVQHTLDGVLVAEHEFVDDLLFSEQNNPTLEQVVSMLKLWNYKNMLSLDIKRPFTLQQAIDMKALVDSGDFKYELLYFSKENQKLWDLPPVSDSLCVVFGKVYVHKSRENLCRN